MRIILVISDETTHNLVSLACRNLDLHVERITDSSEFIALTHLFYPLAVFVDASGPLTEESQYLAWCIKSSAQLHRIALVGLSDDEDTLAKLREAPCDYCYRK